uniref:Mesothelin n=1 Tax=Pelusios castaneus TaxID=367368 RepID=A0A8C8VLT9_9SAUR
MLVWLMMVSWTAGDKGPPALRLTWFLWVFRLSPSVLQGFTCAAANEMETERFQQLAKAMKQKNVKLGEDQVSSRTHRVPCCCCDKDIPKLKPFIENPHHYAVTGSCRQYFANIGEANTNVLQRDSPQRKQLLLEALACLVCIQCLILPSTECPSGKTITVQVAMDELMPIYYTPEELQACLQGVILVEYLAQMANYPFTDQQLAVLKKKLDEMYPNGYPEKIIPQLGAISSLVTIDDIKKWNLTSADTLAFLLRNEPPNDQVISYQLSTCLDASLYPSVSPLFCRMANSLDPSACPQSTKDILYPIAKQAFNISRAFWVCFNLFLSSSASAPGEDLRALSKGNVNMDITTFMNLKKDSVLNLTSDDIKGLLGLNLADLKNQQYNSPVKDWIPLQRQSELNKLGLGFSGGLPDGYISLPPKLESMKFPASYFNTPACVGCWMKPGMDISVVPKS